MTVKEEFLMRPATLDDVDEVVDLLNDVLEAQVGARTYTTENVRSDWQAPGVDPERSMRLMVNAAGTVMAEVSIWDTSAMPVQVWMGLNIHPDYQDLSIGERLLRWGETRAREAIARVPDRARVILATGAHHQDHSRRNLLTAQGFEHVRSYYTMLINMDSPPPAPVLPEGIHIRIFNRAQDMEATMLALHDVFRDHWGFVEQPLEDEIKHRAHWMETSGEYDPTLWFLAVEGDEIVGLSLCSPRAYDDPDAGYVMELGVRRPWRRRGIATALLQHSFGAFWQRGTPSVMLGADADSLTGATRLYEKVGMHVEHEWYSFHKELRPGEDLSLKSLD